jgi:hypothetical protein
MRYDKKVEDFFSKVSPERDIPFKDFCILLGGKGVEYREKLFPVLMDVTFPPKPRPWWKGGGTAKERREKITRHLPGINIPGFGDIEPFTHINIVWGIKVQGLKVVFTPVGVRPRTELRGAYHGPAAVNSEVEKLLLSLLTPVFAELPEPLVTLPLPTWQVPGSICDCGGNTVAVTFFRSDAEKIGREFARKILEVIGDLKEVVKICDAGKSGGDPVGYQQIAEIFAAPVDK